MCIQSILTISILTSSLHLLSGTLCNTSLSQCSLLVLVSQRFQLLLFICVWGIGPTTGAFTSIQCLYIQRKVIVHQPSVLSLDPHELIPGEIFTTLMLYKSDNHSFYEFMCARALSCLEDNFSQILPLLLALILFSFPLFQCFWPIDGEKIHINVSFRAQHPQQFKELCDSELPPSHHRKEFI